MEAAEPWLTEEERMRLAEQIVRALETNERKIVADVGTSVKNVQNVKSLVKLLRGAATVQPLGNA